MEWYEAEVQYLERARQARPPGGGDVVFYGSSSIRLWQSLQADFPAVRPVNLGFGGSTLSACVHFFERLVPPYRPRALVVYAGDNDLGDGQPPHAVVHSFTRLMHKIDRHCGPIRVTYLSIKPSPARWGIIAQIREVNHQIRDTIGQRPGGTYIDLFSEMLGPDGRPRRELFADDGLHLSLAGYRVWAQVMARHADQIF